MTTRIQQDGGAAGEAGEAVGGVLAWIAEQASGIWNAIGPGVGDFIGGVLRGAGLENASGIELIAVGVGGVLLIAAARALFDARPFSAVVTGAIGAAAIAWGVA